MGRWVQIAGLGLTLGCGLALAAGVTPQEAAPQPGPAAVHEDGKTLFQDKGCEYCHGVGGMGTERAPSLLGVGTRLNHAQIGSQIRDGGKAMPAFGEVLAPPEVDALIGYLDTLRVAAPAGKRTSQKRTVPKGERP